MKTPGLFRVNSRLERLRLFYKPSRILLLLVGESPPPHRGFFYDADSPEGQLSRNTRRVFEDVSGVEFADRRDFLSHFKKKAATCTTCSDPEERRYSEQAERNARQRSRS